MRKDTLFGCFLTIVFLLLTLVNFPDYHMYLLFMVWSLDYTVSKFLKLSYKTQQDRLYKLVIYLAVLSPFIFTVIHITESPIINYALYFFIAMIILSFIFRISAGNKKDVSSVTES